MSSASDAPDSPPWGCSEDRIARELVHNESTGGYKTETAAVESWLPVLEDEGVADGKSLEQAFASQSGSTRFDPESLSVVIDGSLRASFALEKLDDGTLAVAQANYCSPAPDASAAKPGPTPIPSAQEGT